MEPVTTDILPPDASRSGKNTVYHHCGQLERRASYAVCLFTLEQFDKGKLRTDSECHQHIDKGLCSALALRAQEVAAGRALFFKERIVPVVVKDEEPVQIVTGPTKPESESYMRGWNAAGRLFGGSRPTTKPSLAPSPKPTPKTASERLFGVKESSHSPRSVRGEAHSREGPRQLANADGHRHREVPSRQGHPNATGHSRQETREQFAPLRQSSYPQSGEKMKHIYESFERIAAVSGNAKHDLLVEELMNEDTLWAMKRALDPMRTYGVGKKTLKDTIKKLSGHGAKHASVQEAELLLERLQDRSLTGSAAKSELASFFTTYSEESWHVLTRIITKDPRAGMSGKSVNKALGRDEIVIFEVNLAHPYTVKRVKKWPVKVELKHDGVRTVCIADLGAKTATFLSG